MLQYQEKWIVRYAHRERNQVVDRLTKISSIWINDMQRITDAHKKLIDLLK